MKKHKFFVNVVANVLLVIAVSVVAVISFVGQKSTEATTTETKAIYRGNASTNKVCLMINVCWGTEHLDSMLKSFEEYGIKTTFFVGGAWVSQNQSVLKRMADEGHEIANHGYGHKDHDKLDYSANKNEIELTHKIVNETIGKSMNLFAPPSGAFNNYTLQSAEALGYKTIMWSRDTIDWRDHNTELIYSRAIKNMASGDLILMHPTKNTAEALPQILKSIRDKNFIATTVTDCIG